MPALNQFIYIGSGNYTFPPPSPWASTLNITGAPGDTNFRRFAMLNDGSDYRLYFFKANTNNTLYQFAWNGSSYAFGHNSIPVITLTNIPADADMSSFAMLHDGSAYRLYVRQLGNPKLLYQAAYVPGTISYEFGYNSIPHIPVTGFPNDTDYGRWGMLFDGSAYRIYFMKLGNNNNLYQGAFNSATNTYEFSFNSISALNLVGAPANNNFASFSMLYGQNNYHCYFQVL
jgi:hypothetical protein